MDKQDLDLFILRCINHGWTTRVLKSKPVSLKYWRQAKKFRVGILVAAFISPENLERELLKREGEDIAEITQLMNSIGGAK